MGRPKAFARSSTNRNATLDEADILLSRHAMLHRVRSGFYLTQNVRGILLMVAARVVFAGSDTFTKLASSRLPATEVVVLRNTISLPIILLLAWRLGGLRYSGALRDRVVIGRSVLEGMGTVAFVAALPFITLGQS